MKHSKRIILLMCLIVVLLSSKAQTGDIQIATDSIIETVVDVMIEAPAKIHYPRKATMYSAVLPGLGQIYNKQWWKTPFIYGGFAGLGYAINWGNSNYRNYKQYYYDAYDKNPETISYESVYGVIDENSVPSNIKTQIMRNIEHYSRLRDLFIIGTAAFYLLNILDANVNAHFIDFDISEDLTLNIEPMPTSPYNNTPIPGLTLVYNF